ncbi:MAG: S4 domain-containing protein [archaeon]
MSHLKRIAMPKSWPIKRKIDTFIVKPSPGKHKIKNSISLVSFLRDFVCLARTKMEAKKIVRAGKISVDNKIIKNEKFAVGLFDRIYIKDLGKAYTIHFDERGKIRVKEIKEYKTKPAKIIGKKVLNKKKQQINLYDGRNILSEEKSKVKDSVLFDLEKKKVLKVLPMDKNAFVFILAGRRKGYFGKITKIEKGKAIVKLDKEDANVPLANLFVVEENERR